MFKKSIFQSRLATIFYLALMWFIFYGLVNYINSFRNAFNPGFGIENSIPFVSFFIYFYFSVYFVIFVPFVLLKNVRNDYLFKVYAFAIIISGIVFLLFPTQMIRPEIFVSSFSDKAVIFLWSIDKPYNLFPSLHVSLAFLPVFLCYRFNRKIGIALLFLAILISISTLLIKQHYLVDVAGGFVVSVIAYSLFPRRQSEVVLEQVG